MSSQTASQSRVSYGKVAKKRGWLIGLLAVVALAVIAGCLGIWWRFYKPTANSIYLQSPTLARVVDLSLVAPGAKLIPFSPEDSFVHANDMRIYRVVSNNEDLLVGIDQSAATSLPTWIAPIEPDATQCSLTRDIVTCANTSVNVFDGQMVTSSQSDSLEPRNETQAEKTFNSENSPNGLADKLPMIHLDPENPGQAKISIDNQGNLASSTGAISDINLDPNYSWAVAVSDGSTKEAIWLVSDGRMLVAIKEESIIWNLNLGDQGQNINYSNQNEPVWFAANDTVVVGDKQGVYGINTSDGSQRWGLESEIVSWFHSGDEISLWTGKTLANAKFVEPTESNHQSSTVISVPESQTQMLSADQIKNSKLKLPWQCGSKLKDLSETGIDPSNINQLKQLDYTAQFQNGEFLSFEDGSVSKQQADAVISDISSSIIDGKFYTAINISCSSQSNYPDSYILLFDNQMNLVTYIPDFDNATDDDPIFETFKPVNYVISGVELTGRELSFRTAQIINPNIEMQANNRTGIGYATLVFDGEKFQRKQVLVIDELSEEILWSWPDNVVSQHPSSASTNSVDSNDYRSQAINLLQTATPADSQSYLPQLGAGYQSLLFTTPDRLWNCGFTSSRPATGCQISDSALSSGVKIPTDILVPFQPIDAEPDDAEMVPPSDVLVPGDGTAATFYKALEKNYVDYAENATDSRELSVLPYGKSLKADGAICTSDEELGAICATDDYSHGFQLSATHLEIW